MKKSDFKHVLKAKDKHNNKYMYIDIFQKGRRKFFIAFCCHHGEFYPEITYHLNGSKCPACSNNVKIDK